ncbi:MAG: hypothetical protein BGO25_05960 [Acidobacteriales bacterium 59-55]|nr:hypothetical protein [Terriglobales bacterium]OJV44619.1 MAG: hypothetical protein BGO25_05960 [Acidobacteriales bacterium 59-55]
MAEINHEIKIHASLPAIYQALTSPSELAMWHTAGATGDHESFTTRPQDGPPFAWKISKAGDDTVQWECVEGPGNSPGTTARFKLSPLGVDRTLVEFSHSGWPDGNGSFRKCNTLWAILLFHLRQYLHSGENEPAFH